MEMGKEKEKARRPREEVRLRPHRRLQVRVHHPSEAEWPPLN